MIERYEPWMYDTINSWFKTRKGHSIPESMLSSVGFIVPNVAVGFLIKTELNLCFFEPFISNPGADKESRTKGLAAVVEALEKEAKLLGYEFCYGVSTAPTMIEHGMKRGWIDLGDHKVIVKELI